MIIFNTKTTPHMFYYSYFIVSSVLKHVNFLKNGVWENYKCRTCIGSCLCVYDNVCDTIGGPVSQSQNQRTTTLLCQLSAYQELVPAVPPVNRRAFLPEPLTQISTELRRYPFYLRNVLFAYRILQKPLFN